MVVPPRPRYRSSTGPDNRAAHPGNVAAVWRVGSAMRVPLRTFALFGLALAMLAGGYWFAPSPGAASMPTPMAKAAPPSESGAQPVATLVASRPPVPLVTPPRTSFFTQTTAEKPSDGKSINLGVFTTNP